MDEYRLLMMIAPALVVILSGSPYQIVLLAAFYMAFFAYFELPSKVEGKKEETKVLLSTSCSSLHTASSENPLTLGTEEKEPAKEGTAKVTAIRTTSLRSFDEKGESEKKHGVKHVKFTTDEKSNDEGLDAGRHSNDGLSPPKQLTRLLSLPDIEGKGSEPAQPTCPLDQDDLNTTNTENARSVKLDHSQDSLMVRSEDSLASKVSLASRPNDVKQTVDDNDERIRLRLPAKDLGYDQKLIESFVETIEKVKPSNLPTMIQLRSTFLQYKKKVEASSAAEKKTLQDEEFVFDVNDGDLDDVDVSSDEEEDAEEKKEYAMAHHRKGFFRRFFHIGKAHNIDSLLTFKKSLIKKALLKVNRDHDEIAIQTFKNIMSFMKDRSTSKRAEEHAQKLVSLALLSEQRIRDEIFLQIIKQTTGHPKIDHCLLGWSLMLVCLVSFQPSAHIRLERYIGKAIQNAESSAAIKERARLARRVLDIIQDRGERAEAPSSEEITAIMKLELVPVTVRIPDTNSDSNHALTEILVDPFTTIAEAEEMMIRKLNIRFTPGFGLCEAHDSHQEPLLGGQRVLDVTSSWQDSLHKETLLNSSLANLGSPSQQPEGTSGAKPDHRRTNSVPTSMTALRKRAHTLQEMEDREKLKLDRGRLQFSKDSYEYLLFQSQIPVNVSGPTRSRNILHDEVSINLLYCQAKRDVMQSRIAVEERDLPKLASLKLHVDQGDYNASVHVPGSLLKDLEKYFPAASLPKNKPKFLPERKDLEEQLLHKYKKLVGVKPLRAKIKYLEYAEKSPMYGTQFYRVMQNKQLQHLPDFINLGISSRGVVFQNPATKEVANQYGMKEIVTWGQSATKFLLVIGDVIQQRKFTFKTPKGLVIKRLVQSGIQIQVFETQTAEAVAENYATNSKFGLTTVAMDTTVARSMVDLGGRVRRLNSRPRSRSASPTENASSSPRMHSHSRLQIGRSNTFAENETVAQPIEGSDGKHD